jgi:indolepyruvate ferredoxin oxidoreductase
MNERAFQWGRLLAEQPGLIDEILHGTERQPANLDAVVARRTAALIAYGGKRMGRRYRALLETVVARETALSGKPGKLSRTVAEAAYRVLAIKDEYEVARMHAAATYGPAPVFHLSPPLLARKDPATGRPRKMAISGRVALPVFRILQHGRLIRGTPLDVFGWQHERQTERAFARQYERDVLAALPDLRTDTLDSVIALAALPLEVRGFGPIKAAAMAAAQARRKELLAALGRPAVRAAA